MKIIIDEQEKLPYSFSCPSVVKKLKTGDYTLEGYEDNVTIERKSLSDYVNSLTQERIRFMKEIKRMRSFDLAVIIVEGSIPDIRDKKYSNPEVNPESIIGSSASIIFHYHIPVIFCSDRQNALDMTFRLLRMFWESKTATKTRRESERSEHGTKRRSFEDFV